MKLKVGMTVKVKNFEKRPGCWNSEGLMDHYFGKTVVISYTDGHIVKLITPKNDRQWTFQKSDFVPYINPLPNELFEI